MIRPLLLLIGLIVALGTFAACDSTSSEQSLFFEQSRLSPDGITRTNASGEVLDADADDWRVAPFFEGAVVVQPAFPNPVARGGLVTITVQDTFDSALTGGVRVSGRNETSNQFILLDEDEGNGPVYVLTFDPSLLRVTGGDDARLFRVRVFDNQNRIVTYGDILAQ